jgi:DNA-binding HxlR family transcriptional regulator
MHGEGAMNANRARLLALIDSSWTTQAIGTAVRLRLPDALDSGACSTDALAAAVGCAPSALRRLLRALNSLDIVEADAQGGYALTEMGRMLCQPGAESLAAWAEYSGTQSWHAWGELVECIRHGDSAYKRSSGTDGFDHLDADPAVARLFHRAIVQLTHGVSSRLSAAVDFGSDECVVDVGGGHGELLLALLQAHPRMHGILFDMPHAIASAGEMLQAGGAADRCQAQVGDFFDHVPANADTYLLKSVLHNWDDERCGRILGHCRLAMSRDARLLVIERLLPEIVCSTDADRRFARSDLNMLVHTSGRERTCTEYSALLEKTGLRIVEVRDLGADFSVLVVVRFAMRSISAA